MRFLGKHKVMAWILAVAIVLSLMSDFSIFEGTKRVYAGDFNDGVYTIEGKLRHATLDQPSMGDSAVTQPMKIIKKGNSISLRLEFKSLTSGIFKGYLYGFYYFPSWNDSENVPKSATAENVKVTEYYEGVYDEYNDPDTGLDSNVKGKLYPALCVDAYRMETEYGLDSGLCACYGGYKQGRWNAVCEIVIRLEHS